MGSFSESNVATNNDVASEDGARGHLVVDGVRNNRGGHRELDRGGVDDADDIARSGSLEEAEEWPVPAVLGVELDDLLIVVGALQEFDASIERTAVGPEEDLDAVDRWVKRVRAEGPTLDGHGGGGAIGRWMVDNVGDNVGGKRELNLTYVADSHRVGPAGGLNHGTEGSELPVLDVHAHLAGSVVGSVPELDVGVERTAFGAEDNLHLLH